MGKTGVRVWSLYDDSYEDEGNEPVFTSKIYTKCLQEAKRRGLKEWSIKPNSIEGWMEPGGSL